jgi:tRNA 2-selenouridine synthase
MPISIDEFIRLRHQQTVIDVRSEGEFQQGHIPGTVNIPLLNNAERVIVGTTYKQQGQQQAIKEGFRLVGPRLLNIITEAERVAQGKEVLVHCWRGGMRSNNFCQFTAMARIRSQALLGGYKAYRQMALQFFQLPLQLTILSGCTGSGKTEVLQALKAEGEQVLDLEQLANHKGSAFGALMMPPQSTTEQFQNNLFEEILKLDTTKRIWIEDESITIGKISLPLDFWKQMLISPLVQMDVSKDVRISRLVNEYGIADRNEFSLSIDKIAKRLGGQHLKAAKEKLATGDMSGTIDILLTYYDKYYLGSLDKKKERIKLKLEWDGSSVYEFVKQLITKT